MISNKKIGRRHPSFVITTSPIERRRAVKRESSPDIPRKEKVGTELQLKRLAAEHDEIITAVRVGTKKHEDLNEIIVPGGGKKNCARPLERTRIQSRIRRGEARVRPSEKEFRKGADHRHLGRNSHHAGNKRGSARQRHFFSSWKKVEAKNVQRERANLVVQLKKMTRTS